MDVSAPQDVSLSSAWLTNTWRVWKRDVLGLSPNKYCPLGNVQLARHIG
jgi:hypothetical protein